MGYGKADNEMYFTISVGLTEDSPPDATMGFRQVCNKGVYGIAGAKLDGDCSLELQTGVIAQLAIFIGNHFDGDWQVLMVKKL